MFWVAAKTSPLTAIALCFKVSKCLKAAYLQLVSLNFLLWA